MIRENKGRLIWSSIVIVLPILIGLLLWNQLPDRIATHWDTQGVANGWSSKAFTVFALPCILLILHWVCVLASNADPKWKNYPAKMLSIVLWICPVISVIMMIFVYGVALGLDLKMERIMPLLVGAMFVVVGNYLPKCKQSYTMGIKLPWTLHDEENWNRTHRMAGKLWVGVGVLAMFSALLPSKSIFIVFMLILSVAVIVPTVYSYLLFKNKEKSGE